MRDFGRTVREFLEMCAARSISDGAYQRMLDRFCALVESGDAGAAALWARLMKGDARRRARLGYRLAEGSYNRCEAFKGFDAPARPVRCFRGGWMSFVAVNLAAFPDRTPLLSFASDAGQRVIPIFGIRVAPGTARYNAEPFGWLEGARTACLLRGAPGFQSAEGARMLGERGIALGEIKRAMRLQKDDVLFVENGEKEYSVEICHLAGAGAKALLRYTVGGADQGERPAGIADIEITDAPCERYL